MSLRYGLLIVLIFATGCERSAPSQPEASQAESVAETQSGTQPREFGDFAFSVPAGWSIVTPDRDKTKAMLLLDGTTWQNAKAMIKVDVGAPAAPSAEQLVEGFANSVGGKVLADVVNLDGVPAVAAETSSVELATPRRMTVAYHNGKAYLLMAAATAGVDIEAAQRQICESWEWRESKTQGN
jgi:hypothetical protein